MLRVPQTVATNRASVRTVLHLAWPVLLEQLLAMLVSVSDTMLAGHLLSRTHLASMSMLAYVLWAMNGVFAFVSLGGAALVARAVGARDWSEANRVLHQALLAGAALALAITASGLALGDRLPWLLGLRGAIARLSWDYLFWMVPVVPLMMLNVVAISCLRGAGDMLTGLKAMLAMNVVNTLLSWALVQGWGPLPELGWPGIAIGTATGYVVGGCWPLIKLARSLRGTRQAPSPEGGLRLRFAELTPHWPTIRRILRIGVPGGVDMSAVVACQWIFVSLINALGEVAMAAHGVALRVESLSYLPGNAFQVAAATLAGQNLGAGDKRQAACSVWAACGLGTTIMTALGAGFYFGANALVLLFLKSDETEVAAAAAPLLRIVSAAMLPFGLMMILSGALRGAGDTRGPLVITFIGFLGVRLPLTVYFTQHLGWGVSGAWYAMSIDLTLRCLLTLWRFQSGRWQQPLKHS